MRRKPTLRHIGDCFILIEQYYPINDNSRSRSGPI